MVYSIAYHFFEDVTTAEEVGQQVFLQLYQSRPMPRPLMQVKRWLRRTATHRSIDLLRRRGRRPEIQMDGLPEVPAGHHEHDSLLNQRLKRLVASLPEQQRAVTILRYGEELDVREIGDILEMPVPTVWSHLRRSLAILRDRFSACVTEEDCERVRTESS